MATEENREKPQINSDEDWKQRVKTEDAALEQRLKEESSRPSADAPGENDEQEPSDKAAEASAHDFPPPSFYTLVGMFSTQAMVALGIIANPLTEKAEVQLPLARHFIDMLGVLENKTKGNLDANEAAILEQTLHQLRIAYVELSKDKSAATAAEK
ncbi:MAG: DUF1844 domain-containing protein [Planctomycetaceae bacterium]